MKITKLLKNIKLAFTMKINKVLIIAIKPNSKEYKLTLDTIKNVLEKQNIKSKIANRDKLKKIPI